MSFYSIKKTADLLEMELKTILEHWHIADWVGLTRTELNELFSQSEFHLLKDDNGQLLAAARINFGFNVKTGYDTHHFPELVGLVAMEKNYGFGTLLVGFIQQNLVRRGIEAIGFCEAQLRPFYQKCGVEILCGKAKFLREPNGDGWEIPTDDDVLNISLKSASVELFNNLNEQNIGYLIF